ncbi:unnamed protein product [Ixodes hexagonus]
MSSKDGKKRKKSYYVDQSKKRHKGCLDKVGAGMKGFLVTFERSEFQATKDCYELLNEYADKLWGAEEREPKPAKAIEEELADELKELKESSSKPRRFKKMSTDVVGNFFINTTVDEPGQLTTSIFSDLKERQSQRSRFLLRLLPVQLTCKAHTESIQKAVKTVLSTYDDDDDRTFLVAKKVRHNSDLDHMSLLTDVVEAVRAAKPRWIGELRKPELVVMLDVQKNICFVSILPNYLEFKKYNLLEVTKPAQPTEVASSGDANIAGKEAMSEDAAAEDVSGGQVPDGTSGEADGSSEGARTADNGADSKSDEADRCQRDNILEGADGGTDVADDAPGKADGSAKVADNAPGKADGSVEAADDTAEADKCQGDNKMTNSAVLSAEEG